MHQLSVDELKTIQLEILDAAAKFCDEHNIKYWLDCGTMLGAVRHKGYIPWDDDIDIGVFRHDYEKFIDLFNQNSKRYKILCFENDPNFPLAFAKIMDTNTVLYEPDEKGRKMCINIDVFPYDNVPDDENAARNMFRRMTRLYILNVARQARIFQLPKGGIIRRLCVYALRAAVRVFPRNYFVKKLIENAKRCMNAETERVANFTSIGDANFSRGVFDSFMDCEFEGKKYKIPVSYDEYLRESYGEYMKLPPEEKRVSTHIFKAYSE